MMKRAIYIHIILLLATLTSCSITRNLPEDEVLYRGIHEMDYGKQPKREAEEDGEGVITAIADAYNTVEGLLSGNASALQPQQTEEEIRDSLKKADKTDTEAYELAREEVEAVLAYAPNAALMGSSYYTHPVPLRLWIYNKYVGSQKRFGKWMFQHFATQPVYVSTVNPKVRTVVAQNTLRNFGYFRGKVTHDTIPGKNPRTAKLSYHVTPGKLFHTDSIAYLNFPQRADSIIQATMWASMLHRGKPFRVSDLDAERKRLSEAFRNNGYYYFRPDYISYRADTLMVPEKVQLQVTPSPTIPRQAQKQYYLGTTRINLYKYNNYQLTDTMTRGDLTFAYTREGKKSPLHPMAIYRYLQLMKRGSLYRQKLEEISTELMSSMGIFSNLRMNFVPRDTTAQNDTLDIVVTAMLDKPYDAEFQGNVTSKSNGQVGPGVSFSMSKHNAFRGAETLSLKAWASYEWQTGANLQGKRSLINSYEYGLTGSLSYPRIRAFGLGRKYFRRAVTSTNYSLDAKWMNRAGYFGRVSLGASLTYTIQKRRNIRHEFTPVSLTYDQLLHTTHQFDSIVSRNQALYVSLRDQFIPAMEYNFSWSSRRHHPRTLKVQVKEAGNVTSAIYATCGNSFGTQGKELFGVPFAQYLKTTAQYTHQFPLTRRSCLATRVFAGMVYSYGNAISAPFFDLFSIGGANSLRAFAIRSIGPGSYHPERSDYSYIDQMGDLKLEANIEYRFPIVAKLYGAVFLDAGNVWLMRDNENQPGGTITLSRLGREIALGTGAGIRYDMDFLVLRFDVGVGLHAPYETERSTYYNMPSFGKSLGYHFAIGYPF